MKMRLFQLIAAKSIGHFSTRGGSEALSAWADALEAHSENLAWLITKEQGKPLRNPEEVAYGIDYIRWFSGEAIRHYGQIVPLDNHHQHRVEHRPVGIVGAITPWNFPFAMFALKLSAAFAAGCSVILKPSEETPLTAIAVTQWLLESGFPQMLFNYVSRTTLNRLVNGSHANLLLLS